MLSLQKAFTRAPHVPRLNGEALSQQQLFALLLLAGVRQVSEQMNERVSLCLSPAVYLSSEA